MGLRVIPADLLCVYLKGLGPQLVQEYLSYLLGDYVLSLVARDAAGRAIASPPWGLILSYEQEIRKATMNRFAQGRSVDSALRSAWADPLLKEDGGLVSFKRMPSSWFSETQMGVCESHSL